MYINIQKFTFINIFLGVIVLGIIVGIFIAIGSDSGKNANDVKRKDDISELAKAIAGYREGGAIPASVGVWCELKQDGTGCLGFPGLIVPKYIKSIPKDPEKGYYKYYSDGNNFSLQAIMSDDVSSYIYLSSSNTYSLQGRNLFSINQSNGTESGNVNGFDSYNSAILSSSDSSYNGLRSIRADIRNSNEGFFAIAPYYDILNGSRISLQAMVWVPIGKTVAVGLRGDDGNGLREVASVRVDGEGKWKLAKLEYALEKNWKKIAIGVHSANYNIDANFSFFVDNLKIEYGNDSTPWVMGN